MASPAVRALASRRTKKAMRRGRSAPDDLRELYAASRRPAQLADASSWPISSVPLGDAPVTALSPDAEPIAVYGGRQWIGLIHVRADGFLAELPDRQARARS